MQKRIRLRCRVLNCSISKFALVLISVNGLSERQAFAPRSSGKIAFAVNEHLFSEPITPQMSVDWMWKYTVLGV